MMESMIGSIVIGGLLLSCVLVAAIVSTVVELGKRSHGSATGNRHRILVTILGIASLFLIFWAIT